MPRPRTPATATDPALAVLFAEQDRRGIASATLADLSGLSANTVSDLRRGTKHPTLRHARKLADALGFTLSVRPPPRRRPRRTTIPQP